MTELSGPRLPQIGSVRHAVRGGDYGRKNRHRLDERDLEPGSGMHTGVARLCPLLRENLRRTLSRRTQSSLRTGLYATAGTGKTRAAVELEITEADLRQLDERPLPRECAGRLYPPGVRGHARGTLAHVPDFDETPRTPGAARACTRMGA